MVKILSTVDTMYTATFVFQKRLLKVLLHVLHSKTKMYCGSYVTKVISTELKIFLKFLVQSDLNFADCIHNSLV
jgi:hypothetical protein